MKCFFVLYRYPEIKKNAGIWNEYINVLIYLFCEI